VNLASALPTARFKALLVAGDKPQGLESALRDQGCSVRRAAGRTAVEALDGIDVLVIATAGIADEEVLDLIAKAITSTSVLVVAESTDVAVRASNLGANIVIAGAPELAAAQIRPTLAVVELKREVARQNGSPASLSPTSGVVQRRSTPLPKEATPDALDALVEAAECLVPMHRFQRVYVDYTLRRFGGNKVHTAAVLGIDRRTIQRWARALAEQQIPGEERQTQSS